MGIKHRADSGFRKFRVLSKVCLGGQVRSSEMPNASYTNRCAHSQDKANSCETISTIVEMKYTHLFLILVCFLGSGCAEDKIDLNEGRMEMPEPDKHLRVAYEVKQEVSSLTQEIDSSNQISTNQHALKIVNSGVTVLPYLRMEFYDTLITNVFSQKLNRNLRMGEIYILLANEIKPIPIGYLAGNEKYTPPTYGVESFLDSVNSDQKKFSIKYDEWLKGELKNEKVEYKR